MENLNLNSHGRITVWEEEDGGMIIYVKVYRQKEQFTKNLDML